MAAVALPPPPPNPEAHHPSDDDAVGPLPGFEGVEKVLELDAAPNFGPERGLREITRSQWDRILTAAKCTILNSLSNDKFDSYVLSESSLFVYPHKMILKTCGTTTLLRTIPIILEIMEVSNSDKCWYATLLMATARCEEGQAFFWGVGVKDYFILLLLLLLLLLPLRPHYVDRFESLMPVRERHA
jgi:hypothetical protein